MIFSLRASAPRSQSAAWAGSSISSIIFMTASLAPPCSGPLSAPMAAVTPE